jgi:insulysin
VRKKDTAMHVSTPRPRLFLATLLAGAYLLGASALAQDVITSPNDSRQYESFVLPNQLKVLVISDPDTDKAAAAMDVFVGSSSDPADRQGLAHFLEHMLFLGTEKYPQPGEYQSFISSHGGRHNAYTAYEHTNYFFDIDKDYLEPTLDRFAQFFVAPLFTPEYVDREKNAVDSEYQSKRKEDGMRLLYAWKQVTNPRHPFSTFDVGSMQTLADRDGSKVRDELIAFYNRHYSANLMALVVLGKEPVSVLRDWVTKKFTAVKNVNAQPLHTTEPLFRAGQLPARLDVVPLKDRQLMMLTFPIPTVIEHFRSKPVQYIANLLGHEGAGSLLSLLKRKGWVDSLSAGLGTNNRSEAAFNVSLQLTKTGTRHVDEVASAVFQYLRVIEDEGLAQWIFDEQRRMSEISFRFAEKSAPLRYASALAYNLQVYPVEDVVRGPYTMDVYEPVLIRRFLGELTPQNVLLTVNAQGLQTDAKDPWFDTPYQFAPVDTVTLRRWRTAAVDPALAIPSPNVFLPEDLSIKPPREASERPVRIRETKGIEVWFKQDTTFGVPRTDFFFSVRSPFASDSSLHAVLTELYVQLVNEQLNEYTYPAHLAGLSYELYRHTRGFTVRISGYSDKQAVLLARIVETLAKLKVEPARFVVVKDDLAQRWRNSKKDQPYRQTTSEVTELLLHPYWTDDQRLRALSAITARDLEAFIPELLGRIDIVVLAHGNLYRDDALGLTTTLEETLLRSAVPTAVPRSQIVKLTPGTVFLSELQVDHPDSAVTVYSQGRDKRYSTMAKTMLASQIIAAPFYNDLRTEKQLGYVVYASSMPLLEVPGIGFIVQSPNTDPSTLQTQIDQFIVGYARALAAMSEQEFGKHKEGLLARLLEKEQNLSARSDRYWTEIDRYNYKFNTRERLARAVRRIRKAEFEAFYRDFLTARHRTRLIVRTTGSNHATRSHASETPRLIVIDDPTLFKEGKKYFRR